MTEKRFRWKIRMNEKSVPIMQGHMHINVWLQNYVARLPRTRKNMMFKVRKKFKCKYVKMVMMND